MLRPDSRPRTAGHSLPCLSDLSPLFCIDTVCTDDPLGMSLLSYFNWTPLSLTQVGWIIPVLDSSCDPPRILSAYQILQASPVVLIERVICTPDDIHPQRGFLPSSLTVLACNVLGLSAMPEMVTSIPPIPCSPPVHVPTTHTSTTHTSMPSSDGTHASSHSSLTEKNRAASRGLGVVCLLHKASIDRLIGVLGDPKSTFAMQQACHYLPTDLVNLPACKPENIHLFLTWAFSRTPVAVWPPSGKFDSFHLLYLHPSKSLTVAAGAYGVNRIRELVQTLCRVLTSVYSVHGEIFAEAFAPLLALLGDGELVSLRNFDSGFVLDLVSFRLCALSLGLQTIETTFLTRESLLAAMHRWLAIDLTVELHRHTMYLVTHANRPQAPKGNSSPATFSSSRPRPGLAEPMYKRPQGTPGPAAKSAGNLCTKHLASMLLPGKSACSNKPCSHTHLDPIPSPIPSHHRDRLSESVMYLRESPFKAQLLNAIRALP